MTQTLETFDVVVVGGGNAGFSAAHAAAERGRKVLLLERGAQGMEGGNSYYTAGATRIPHDGLESLRDFIEPDERHDVTIVPPYSSEEYMADLIRVTDGKTDRGMAEVLTAEAGDAVRWLSGLGLKYRLMYERQAYERPDGTYLFWGGLHVGNVGGGVGLIEDHTAVAAKLGTEVRYGAHVVDLLTEGDAVVGVRYESEDGSPHEVRAESVILAAGGFESSAALRARHGVPGGADRTMAPAGANTGDAIEAAVRIGAAAGRLDQAWFCPGLLTPGGLPAFTLGFRGGLIVDGSGRRFANESLPYDQMGRRMAAARGPFHLIFDSRSEGLPAISVPPLSPDEQLAAGHWVRADTLDELAGRIGVPADALTGTVERFNGFADKGADDDFHRGEDPYDRFFSGGASPLVAVDRPPYRAAQVVLSDLGTKGGLLTDPDGRVLDGSGRPIAGLYAAGNTSASFTGPVYPGPGIPIGSAMAFAYRAVQDMRREHP